MIPFRVISNVGTLRSLEVYRVENFAHPFSFPQWAEDSYAGFKAFCQLNNAQTPNGLSCCRLSMETGQDDRELYIQSGYLYKIHFNGLS
jgi:hypothetical protein